MAERKGLKLRRQVIHRSYYAAQPMRTAMNQKRRMRNHIRANPADQRSVRIYETVKNFGVGTSFGLNSKGRKLHKRYEREALIAAAEGAEQ